MSTEILSYTEMSVELDAVRAERDRYREALETLSEPDNFHCYECGSQAVAVFAKKALERK